MKKELHIEGMTCKHCSMKVENKLLEICGVSSVEVNVDSKTAIVQLNHEVSDLTFEESIGSIGYTLLEIKK
ncbi:heavy-metal-associated domain-containing protein [Candidatus Xianfuyuplasma coldseepsis]|jgi:copper chaperone CopZ|uniref:Heavy-metal-associated domain-containing protein n=1 Tax=Candidatus Xianfuyuplasma coldseepsis TaxID=2782163 RepID=A0A7L7KRC4_9MOLU|nr:heavy-metal-associated domain-containing protein [Xianfuyuplasma coldseepsis]QMS85247.1 heavy-metal-associated domain-containing protein [Xianfuyuplasma coldseepsis]